MSYSKAVIETLRAIRGKQDPLPLYSIDESGRAHELGFLEPIYPTGCATLPTAFPWPLDDEMADGWFRGLPYPLGDMRPQGFLGRNFAHQHSAILQVDEAVNRWSEEDALHALSVLGWDQPGNYILGEESLRRFQVVRELILSEWLQCETRVIGQQAADQIAYQSNFLQKTHIFQIASRKSSHFWKFMMQIFGKLVNYRSFVTRKIKFR